MNKRLSLISISTVCLIILGNCAYQVNKPLQGKTLEKYSRLLAEVRVRGKGSGEKECIDNLSPFPFNLSPIQDRSLSDLCKSSSSKPHLLAQNNTQLEYEFLGQKIPLTVKKDTTAVLFKPQKKCSQ